MNSFHRQRLQFSIRDTHRIPVSSDWAFAIRKQARLILLPLFREILVEWKLENGFKRPQLTSLAKDLFRGYFSNGEMPYHSQDSTKEIVNEFCKQLSDSDKSILKFYFLSEEDNLAFLYNAALDGFTEELCVEVSKLDRIAGKSFVAHFDHFSDQDLNLRVLEELREIENIISDSDLEMDLDPEAITRINEAFSDYLDIPNGEISLFQSPIKEWEFWEKVTVDEAETVGKQILTEHGLEWVECWLLPDGTLRAKGNLESPEERDQAAIQSIQEEFSLILQYVQDQLKERYQLLNSQVHYTFFTRRKNLENILPGEGIDFFEDQIQAHGSDDFEPGINLEIHRYQNKELYQWGTQISLGIDERYWLTVDEQYEFKVWVMRMEGEAAALETRFSENQKEAIIQSILDNIHRSYQLDHETK